eukprot:5586573-Prymnesium_polylepis.1
MDGWAHVTYWEGEKQTSVMASQKRISIASGHIGETYKHAKHAPVAQNNIWGLRSPSCGRLVLGGRSKRFFLSRRYWAARSKRFVLGRRYWAADRSVSFWVEDTGRPIGAPTGHGRAAPRAVLADA